MNDLIREALTEIGEHVVPPAPDVVAFDQRVRTVRRRRTARRTSLVAAVAATVVGAGFLAPAMLHAGEGEPRRFASTGTPATGEDQPVWFVQAGELRAALEGKVVRTDHPAEQVLGATASGVWFVDDDSHLRWINASRDGDGLDTAVAPAPEGSGPAPVAGRISSAVLSTDARVLAWVTLDEQLVVWSVGDSSVQFHRQLRSGDRLFGVSASGALVEQDGTLNVIARDRTVGVTDSDFISASITGRTVTVRDYPRGTPVSTRVFALEGDVADLVRTLPGHAWTAPDETTVVTLPGEDDPTLATVTRDGGEAVELAGLDHAAHALEFTGHGSVVLAVVGGDGDALVECGLASATCRTLVAAAVPNGPLIRLVDPTL